MLGIHLLSSAKNDRRMCEYYLVARMQVVIDNDIVCQRTSNELLKLVVEGIFAEMLHTKDERKT